MRTIALVLLGFLSSCNTQQTSSLQDDEAKLLRIHEAYQEAHVSKNAQMMVETFADDKVSVNRGKITRASKEEDIARLQQYFNSVEFKKWDDVNPPVIRFSDDHSLAYVIVDKIVMLNLTDSVGRPIEETTHFGWVSIFRKQPDGDFKLECVASTNEPTIVKPL